MRMEMAMGRTSIRREFALVVLCCIVLSGGC